ncbi:hypothetical protein C8R42DRAFT_656362 [Lentinula raphanica]|nr:hypothetical protein C8R42DRAFT_656362 [Lentinula raphanica]
MLLPVDSQLSSFQKTRTQFLDTCTNEDSPQVYERNAPTRSLTLWNQQRTIVTSRSKFKTCKVNSSTSYPNFLMHRN